MIGEETAEKVENGLETGKNSEIKVRSGKILSFSSLHFCPSRNSWNFELKKSKNGRQTAENGPEKGKNREIFEFWRNENSV